MVVQRKEKRFSKNRSCIEVGRARLNQKSVMKEFVERVKRLEAWTFEKDVVIMKMAGQLANKENRAFVEVANKVSTEQDGLQYDETSDDEDYKLCDLGEQIMSERLMMMNKGIPRVQLHDKEGTEEEK